MKSVQKSDEKAKKIANMKLQKNCMRFYIIITAGLFWLLLIIFIIAVFISEYAWVFYLISFCLCYLCYIAVIFFTEEYKKLSGYLKNKITVQEIYEKMGNSFAIAPKIRLICECSHNEIKFETQDNGLPQLTTERVSESKESHDILYYSARDISGVLYLAYDEAHTENKKYIQLDLEGEIYFSDAVSYMDTKKEVDEIYNRNKFKDQFIEITDNRELPGLAHQYFVKLCDNEPCYISKGWLIFFSILALFDLYRYIFNSACFHKVFKVRKFVSRRYDLTHPSTEEGFSKLAPQLNILGKKYTYEPHSYRYVDYKCQVKTPTKEELKEAEQYKDKVPFFVISRGDNNIPEGIIEDDIDYSDFLLSIEIHDPLENENKENKKDEEDKNVAVFENQNSASLIIGGNSGKPNQQTNQGNQGNYNKFIGQCDTRDNFCTNTEAINVDKSETKKLKK